MDKKKIKNAIIVAVVLGGIFLAYSFLVKGGEEDLLVETQVGGISRFPAVQELFTILGQLSELTIDTSLFQNPVYVTLEDNTVTVSPQARGRLNPFRPF